VSPSRAGSPDAAVLDFAAGPAPQAGSVTLSPIRRDEIPYVAAMHLGGANARETEELLARGGAELRFRMDKVAFYAREEPEGFLLLREGGLPVGFLICAADTARLRRASLLRGYWLKWAVRALLGRYGFQPSRLRQFLRIPMAFLRRSSRSRLGPKEDDPAPIAATPRVPSRPGSARRAFIYSVAVLRDSRRRGYARKLIEAGEAYLCRRGAARVEIAVLKDNLPARRAYEQAGFRVVGTVRESLGEAHLMEKDLSSPSRRQKIVHIITRMVPGGAQRVVRSLIDSAARLGHPVTLVTGRDPLDEAILEELRRGGAAKIRVVPELVRNPHPLKDLLAARRLRRILREEAPAVVHTHTSKAGLLGRWAAHKEGVPRIVHSTHGHPFSIHGRLAGRLYTFLERRAAAWCDALAVLSRDETGEYLRRRIGGADRILAIGNGLPPSAYSVETGAAERIRRELRLRGQFVVGTVCRLSREKGLPCLLEAFARLGPSAVLLIVGDGPMRVSIEGRARRPDLAGRVHFAGFQRRPAEWMAAMDVFVLASTYEGFGLAALEAMAAGVPVVATRVGGLRELLEGGRGGVLVPPGDPEALATAIRSLMADHRRRSSHIEEGRRIARQRTEERTAGEYLELYGLQKRQEPEEANPLISPAVSAPSSL